ncbi:hypothetical protein [Halohasta litorea]|uniref:Uncharacterized protein n=1 Tax=Halohasta litorea TaxID=869891 RepID=A0ABD6D359_9EURY|nr:hypothetical protein [Halohasta litorea]
MEITQNQNTVRERGVIDRVQHLASEANPAFATGSIIVPLTVLAISVVLQSPQLLFYTHVAAGAVWFGFALIFPAVIGPALGGLDDENTIAVTTQLTPKLVFFILGFSFTTVLSGTVLLTTEWGLGYGFSGLWSSASLGLGWGLFFFGLVVPNRIHLQAYYESRSEKPDFDRLAAIEKRNALIGIVEAIAMLGIIFLMTGLRLG